MTISLPYLENAKIGKMSETRTEQSVPPTTKLFVFLISLSLLSDSDNPTASEINLSLWILLCFFLLLLTFPLSFNRYFHLVKGICFEIILIDPDVKNRRKRFRRLRKDSSGFATFLWNTFQIRIDSFKNHSRFFEDSSYSEELWVYCGLL